jgi:hypothetical protein
LRFKAEYFMPDGQPWYSESLEQRGIQDSDPNVLIVSEYVSDKAKDNGQQLATTDDGGYLNSGERRFPKKAGNNPALMWNLFEFKWFHKIKFIGNAHARALTSNRNTLFINQSPGEYTVKVFYKGEHVRETSFSIADGDFVDNGLAKQNKISTNKIILPVKVVGNVDKWNAAAWKTDAFYRNPLTGFGVQ